MAKTIINKNALPFFILALIHTILLFILLKRKKHKNVWLLLVSNMGFAYLFEYVILNLFHGYKYKPLIFKNRYLDEIFGAILSQGVYVPISATFLTLTNMKWWWKFTFSLFYFFIEKLFIRLKVYRVYWWRPIYTLLLLNLYFYISDRFNRALTNKRKWAMSVTYYLSIEVIGISLMYISALLRQIRFGKGAYHTWREHFVIAPIYSLILSYIGMKNASKPGIIYRFSMLIYTIGIDLSLACMGVLKIKFKQILGSIPLHIAMIFISRFLYLYIFKIPKATT